jgi:hypothetical protein
MIEEIMGCPHEEGIDYPERINETAMLIITYHLMADLITPA